MDTGISNKEFGKLMGLTVQDILSDYSGDNENSYFDTCETIDKSIIKKQVAKQVSSFIRERFLNIIDGIF